MKFAALLVFLVVVLGGTQSFAELKKQDLQRQVVVTEEAALLTQVDTVSLYLSSPKVALAPRLNQAHVIEVEMTILDPALVADQTGIKGFVQRIIDTFISVLKERLPIYAPAIAGKFDASKDIIFKVNVGASRAPFGIYRGSAWSLSATPVAVPVASAETVPAAKVAPVAQPTDLNETRVVENETKDLKTNKGCDCPALR